MVVNIVTKNLMKKNTTKVILNQFMRGRNLMNVNIAMKYLVLLKNPGAPLANRSAPGFFSRFHRKFLAQNLKIVRIQI